MIYKSVDIWRRLGPSRLMRYHCFEVLPSGGFCVQSADVYEAGNMQRSAEHDKQFLELLAEDAPEGRAGSFPTLEEAIESFDAEFCD
jgi:hypothetical protein